MSAGYRIGFGTYGMQDVDILEAVAGLPKRRWLQMHTLFART